MKKIYSFNQCVMNGSVQIQSVAIAFSNMELAEQTRQILTHANYENTKLNIMPLRLCYSDVEETVLFESADEINDFIKKP